MLTARSVVIATMTVAVVSLIASCLSLMRSLDSGGAASDSYGTRAQGYRALFETLHELQVPVERVHVPPSDALAKPVTLVLCAPHADLVQLEPVYLRQVRKWVENGGRVVVAPGPEDFWTEVQAESRKKALKLEETSLLQELGLPDVTVEEINLSGASSLRRHRLHGRGGHGNVELDLQEMKELFVQKASAVRSIGVQATGNLAYLGRSVASLAVPESDLQVIDVSESPPDGQIKFKIAGDANEHTLAASYRLGKGEVVVVGDPALLQNRFIAQADNVLLASRLLAVSGRTIAFDEFYHGLTIRGNPFWLLTQLPFAFLAFSILIATGLWGWRQAVFLGPPLQPALAVRRTLAEYVEAMARFLQRGRSSNAYILEEVRNGVLWALRNELRLKPGQETLDSVSQTLARKRPQAARQLIDAVTSIDAELAGGKPLKEQTTVTALQRISVCL